VGPARLHLPHFATVAAALAAMLVTAPAAAAHDQAIPTGCTVPVSGSVDAAPTDRPLVSITFDENLGSYTRQILDTFDRYGMHGTFFTVGKQAEARPRLAQLILSRGSELGDHSYSHLDLSLLPDFGFDEYRRGQDAIKRVTGFQACLARPPGGTTSPAVVDAATRLGMKTVLWGPSPCWCDPNPRRIARVTLHVVGRGGIVLLHQVQPDADALDAILQGLQDRGLRSVPVTKLLGGQFTHG
jgi:peptidoglycan/xylan/chitin deacetylase (PgdA/CDA1 family)